MKLNLFPNTQRIKLISLYQVRKELEEASTRGGAGSSAAAPDAPDEKPLAVKKEEPDPEVSVYC